MSQKTTISSTKKKSVGILYDPLAIQSFSKETFDNLSPNFSIKTTSEQEDRMVGSILGLSFGDLTGCPVEGGRQDEIEKWFGDKSLLNIYDFKSLFLKVNNVYQLQNPFEILLKGQKEEQLIFPSSDLIQTRKLELGDKQEKNRKKTSFEMFLGKCRFPGITSDDTQQGMALINSMIEYELLNNDKEFCDIWGKWLIRGFEDNNCKLKDSNNNLTLIGENVKAFRDYGQNSSAAFTKLKKGISAKKSGSPSSGIGGIMRGSIAPTCYALYHYNNNEDIIKLIEKYSFEQCFTTHAAIEGASCCFAVNLCAYKFIEVKDNNAAIDWILENLVNIVREAETKWWNEAEIIEKEIKEKKEESKEEKKDKKNELKKLKNEKSNQLKWHIYKTLHTEHAISECLEQLFKLYKELRGTEQEVTLLSKLREKISELARIYKPEKKNMRAHVNQGFCLLGGLHSICCCLIPENPDIIYYCHGDKSNIDTTTVDSNDVFNTFPNLILRSVITLGYDTDTIGAIVGYLLGARFGSNWIPKQLIFESNRIEKNYINVLIEILRERKSKEFTLGNNQMETIDDYVNRERFLTLSVELFQHAVIDRHVPFVINDNNRHVYGNATNRVELHTM
ncbi:hypothetical protein ABK040_007482 [Willaertia magna]